MTIIHYLLRKYDKFGCDALVGFGLAGMVEMCFEAYIIFNLLSI